MHILPSLLTPKSINILRNFILLLALFSFLSSPAQDFTENVKRFIAIDTTTFALVNAKVYDGLGGAVKTEQTLVVEDGKILAIGPSSEVKAPVNALIIDCSGKTIIPGMVMLHEHMFYTKTFEDFFSVGQLSFTFPRLYLAGGTTTIRTAGSIQVQTDLNLKKAIDKGQITGPKMDVTSPHINRPREGILELGNINSPEQARKSVEYWAAMGVTSFKVYENITRDDLKAVVDEAHKLGHKVTGHLCSVTFREAAEIGIDNLEHGFFVSSDFVDEKKKDLCDPFERRKSLRALPEDSEEMKDLMQFLIKKKVAITSTLNVFEPFTGREAVPGGGEDALVPSLRDKLYKQQLRYQFRDSALIAHFKKEMYWEKQFHDMGGLLVYGTDPTGAGRTVAGYANQRGVELLVEAGFSISEAIKICTLNGAIYLDQQESIGTLEAGKIADIVLIDGDLEGDVSNIRKMEIIFKDGIGWDSQKMFKSVNGLVGLN